MRAAIIKNGTVQNIVEVKTLADLPNLVVPVGANGRAADIGDLYDGANFIADNAAVIARGNAAIDQVVSQLLVGGIEVIAAAILTGDKTQLQAIVNKVQNLRAQKQ